MKQDSKISEHFRKLGKASWEVRKALILSGKTLGNKKKKKQNIATNKEKIV